MQYSQRQSHWRDSADSSSDNDSVSIRDSDLIHQNISMGSEGGKYSEESQKVADDQARRTQESEQQHDNSSASPSSSDNSEIS
jgi:hypothetical protein